MTQRPNFFVRGEDDVLRDVSSVAPPVTPGVSGAVFVFGESGFVGADGSDVTLLTSLLRGTRGIPPGFFDQAGNVLLLKGSLSYFFRTPGILNSSFKFGSETITFDITGIDGSLNLTTLEIVATCLQAAPNPFVQIKINLVPATTDMSFPPSVYPLLRINTVEPDMVDTQIDLRVQFNQADPDNYAQLNSLYAEQI